MSNNYCLISYAKRILSKFCERILRTACGVFKNKIEWRIYLVSKILSCCCIFCVHHLVIYPGSIVSGTVSDFSTVWTITDKELVVTIGQVRMFLTPWQSRFQFRHWRHYITNDTSIFHHSFYWLTFVLCFFIDPCRVLNVASFFVWNFIVGNGRKTRNDCKFDLPELTVTFGWVVGARRITSCRGPVYSCHLYVLLYSECN